MKLTKEQLEDIITVGEAKAAAGDKQIDLYLLYEGVKAEGPDEDGEKYSYLGYKLEFRPKPERINRSFSSVERDETTILDYYDSTTKGEWNSPEVGLAVGFAEWIKDRNPEKPDFIIKYAEQKYASWEPFARAFGITGLVTFATKIPRALAVKLTRICEDEGETPSWRIRMLLQDYLTEQIKDRVRQVLFEE